MKNKKKDQVFAQKMQSIAPFEFNQQVAEVFDNMVQRSIPFYCEINKLILDITHRYYQGTGKIYDLGCSTGTTLKLIADSYHNFMTTPKLKGIDSSAPMIEKAKEKCREIPHCELEVGDMTQCQYHDGEILIFSYILQFLKIEQRKSFLTEIYRQLPKGSLLIISEKIHSPSDHFQELITDLYSDFKRMNGYSELEIAQKREALENVLITQTPSQLQDMLLQAGFERNEMIFRWYNFASFLAIK